MFYAARAVKIANLITMSINNNKLSNEEKDKNVRR
jgi:hypothetical protein